MKYNMTLFSYKATDRSGKVVTGTLEAVDEKGVVSLLQEMGNIPIRITEGGKTKVSFSPKFSESFLNFFNRVSTKEILNFTVDLGSLLSAGLPLDKALTVLISVAEKENFKKVIREILKSVEGGSYLSDALAKFPQIFSEFYVSMIRAGEAGGVLEDVLERLGDALETTQDLTDYIKSAMVYPIFLLFVLGGSIIILMTFVIPKFSMIFEDLGSAIPWSTQMLLAFSEVFKGYWWAMLLFFGVVYFSFLQYIRTPSGRIRFDKFKLVSPLIGDLVKKIEVARFSRTLGTLANSGVPILEALDLVNDIVGNKIIADSMGSVYERVKKGERISSPLSEIEYFPPLAVQMITVGEETGRLDEMLLRVADNYEKAVKDKVKGLISMLEPAMILVMGLVVGFIVVSMLMAIFSMNDMPF